MNITVGVNANHADSSICIFKENKLVFALEEERINRIKHWAGVPLESLKLGLKYCEINPKNINIITLNTNPFSNLDKKIYYFVKKFLFSKKAFEIFRRQKKKFNIKKQLINNLDLNKNIEIKYFDHHTCHISSAFYPSGFDKAIGLSIDGFGDFCSIAIAKCENKKISIIKKIFFPNSLGVFYESLTQLIGFKKYGEEYKMMGLSSYGKPKYFNIIKENMFNEKKLLELNLDYFNHAISNFSYNFQGSPNQNLIFNSRMLQLLLKNNNIDNVKNDIAASAQKVFEFYLNKIINEIIKINFSKNLVFAGGCALNSLANRILFENKYFKKIFIPYAPGDSGGSIGSALLQLSQKFNTFEDLKTPYLGPKYTNDEIKIIIQNQNLIKKFKIEFIHDENLILNKIAKEIVQKKIIGLFSGRAEFGARALGNRSIIASPCFLDMKEIINLKIKKRENFRPFAPAILEDKKNDWFVSNHSNPYMSNVEYIKKEKQKFIPAVTHIDGTGRVQTVSKQENNRFYNLIQKFFNITKVPIILNTSFNENEPMVMKPEEAIKCFERTEMDILVLENFLISRK